MSDLALELCRAAAGCDVGALKRLLSSDVSPTEINNSRHVSRCPRIGFRKRFFATPLMHALQMEACPWPSFENQRVCVQLLLKHKANANDSAGALTGWPGPDPPESALFHVAKHGRQDLADVLLQHGADPNAENCNYGLNATDVVPVNSACRDTLVKYHRQQLADALSDCVLLCPNVTCIVIFYLIPIL